MPRHWLEPYGPETFEALRAATPTDLPPLPEPPTEEGARAAAVRETGAPLVEVPGDIATYHAYLEFGSPKFPQKMLARDEVIERIRTAQTLIPAPFTLLVLDTWRSREAQRELGRIYREAYPDLDATFVADPDDTELIAPHTLGAAVDLTLAFEGKGLPLGSDFDQFDATAGAMYLEREDSLTDNLTARDELDRDLRRVLSHAMLEAGFAPLASEWWHFSYGDQRWAAFYGHDASLYDQIDYRK